MIIWYNFAQMKDIIRNQIKNLLNTHQCKADVALEVLSKLQPLINISQSIAIYRASGFELKLDQIIQHCLLRGKQLYQPVAYRNSRHMRLMKYEANYDDIFSVEEFIPHACYEWYNLDLILLPLMAVSMDGYRLGKGGGYYDTTLDQIKHKKSSPILCGVGFDFQLIPYVPHQSWDIRLDYFVSELQLIKF